MNMFLLFLLLLFPITIYSILLYSLRESRKHYKIPNKGNDTVSLRKFPYPFSAALTVCSDIDSTRTLNEFLTIQEFLTTRNDTELGKGVGLEIGNSFFPNDADNPFAYFSKYPDDQEVITDLIKAGYIDCIHSFLSAKRHQVQKQVAALTNNNCKVPVWVNHARAETNFGQKDWAKGDTVNSDYYHADFSLPALGCTFAWFNDRATITSVIGQGVPLRLTTFFSSLDREHLVPSLINNVAKEIFKFCLSFGSNKFMYRKDNDLVYVSELNDGQRLFSFIRNNISYQGFGKGRDGAPDLVYILRPNIFKSLIKNEGYMIIYTHLGKNNGYPFLSREIREGFKLLEQEYRTGDIYVTTTSKLLTYHVNRKYLNWHAEQHKDITDIHIDSISDPVRGTFQPTPDSLQGITFYTDQADKTRVFIGGEQVHSIELNSADHTGQESVSIPLRRLESIDNKMKEYRTKGYLGQMH